MKIQLSDHFGYGRLIRFTLPSIGMTIFMSLYSVVDGYFVSNFVGKTPFAAMNYIAPILMILGVFGFMFGAGGSALISKTMGEEDPKKANRVFSLIIYTAVVSGLLLAILGQIFLRPIGIALGAEGEMLEGCVTYGRVILIGLPAYILQFAFQSLFVAAEKPQHGLAVTVIAGLTNVVLDFLLVGVFSFGLTGAAAATVIGQMLGGFLPLIYFARPNSSRLRLGKTKWDGKALAKTCTNGSSEFVTNASASVVGMLYNIQLLKYAGENGVAAYGVLMYVNMVFLAIFVGYTVGTTPVIGYHYGARNHHELRSLRKESLLLIVLFSVVMFALAQLLARPLALFFVGYDVGLIELTQRAFRIFGFNFLFAGIGIFGSGFFTALNNGLVSATISFLRTLVFQVAAVMTLPLLWNVDGIWLSSVVAELLAAVVAILFLAALRKRYQY